MDQASLGGSHFFVKGERQMERIKIQSKSIAGLLLLGTLSITATVQAAAPGVGTLTDAGIFSVYENGGSSGPGGADFQGGEGVVTSHAVYNELKGLAESQAAVSGTSVVAPGTLRALIMLSGLHESVGPFGTIVGGTGSSSAMASEKFKYTGNINHTETVNFTLDYTAMLNGDSQEIVYAEVGAVSDVNYFFSKALGDIVSEGGGSLLTSNNGVDEAYNLFYTNTGDGTLQSVSLAITFDLVPGQEFFLHSRLGVAAHLGDDFVDAYNTLTGEFTNPSLFQNISDADPVPSPTSSAMLTLVAAVWVLNRRSCTILR